MSYCNYRKWRLSQFIKQKRYKNEFDPDRFICTGALYRNDHTNSRAEEGYDATLKREDVEDVDEGDYHIPKISLISDSSSNISSLSKNVKQAIDNIKFVLPPGSRKEALKIPELRVQEWEAPYTHFDIAKYISDDVINNFLTFHPERRGDALGHYVGTRVHNVVDHPNFSHPLMDKIKDERHKYPAKNIPKDSPFREIPSKSDLSRIMGYYSSRLYENYMTYNSRAKNKMSFLEYAKKLGTEKSSERVRILHNILTDILEGQHLPTSKANKVYGEGK